MTIGMDKPIMLVNSAMVDVMDEEELRWVLAHELGHALSGHARLSHDPQPDPHPQRHLDRSSRSAPWASG